MEPLTAFWFDLISILALASCHHFLSNYFQIGKQLYQQIQVTHTGSTMSEISVEVTLQALIRYSLFLPEFWKVYVNDTFIFANEYQVFQLHHLLNTSLSELEITFEATTTVVYLFLNTIAQVTYEPPTLLWTTRLTSRNQVLGNQTHVL